MTGAANIAAMTPEQAGARLAELTQDPNWGSMLMNGNPAVRAEFDALGRKMHGVDEPSPAADPARVALDKFTSDTGLARRLFAGDVNTVRQFQDLINAASSTGPDALVAVLDGPALPPSEQMPPSDTRAAINLLREAGLEDGSIFEAFTGRQPNGQPYDRETIETVKAFRASRLGDSEWVRRLMTGGYGERRELTLWSIVLANAA